ncbi:heme biosynthesis protein HemY [Stappia sp. MMSF_3263]|uniref:heme biosynthesis protein HemY n=1 Tax=Stappia sp. MMSF_3263 TaxID=3046693 RepID=UPI00273FDA5D|nr:heme biosynthesis HemY N-terminal domain-containing protein [Stappia sp. MMSF_3263]
MIRLLIFIALLFVVALGAAWLADRPGVITLDWQGYRIEAGLMTAAVALFALLAAGIIVWNLALFILRSPGLVGRFFRRRRKDRGYEALSRGMLALGVGDAVTASRQGNEAQKLLRQEPAAELLLAQSAQLAGRHEEARGRFEAMLEDPDLKAVGLHGLYVEAERLGEPVAALHYAEEAAKLVPGLPWAGRAVLGYQAVSGDWEEAIKSLERNYAAKLVDKKTFRRHKAVLLTAQALECEDRDPDAARGLAGEAHGLAPALVPAAVVAARLATRRGDIRKAMKVVETSWKLNPHPELAEAYAHARNGDSALDRLKRVKALAALRAHNVEGALALARAALEASDYALARAQLKAALTLEPTRRVFLLMAELEETQHGDRGRVREWLARAVRAPADPAWVADGVVSESWAPVSPVDGRLDAFTWALPPATLDHEDTSLEALDEALFEALPAVAASIPADVPSASPVAGDRSSEGASGARADVAVPPVEEAQVVEDAAEPATPARAAASATDTPEKSVLPRDAGEEAARTPTTATSPAVTPADGPKTADAQSPGKAPADGSTGAGAAAPVSTAPANGTAGEAGKPSAETGDKKPAGQTSASAGGSPAKAGPDLSRPIEFPLKHMPDDPGPDGDDEEPPKKPGYRFFN